MSARIGDLAQAVRRVLRAYAVEAFLPRAAGASIELDAVIEPGRPQLMADEHHLRQVLANLIDNALTFTPAGGLVRIGAARRDDRLRVSISDTGPGIPSEHLSGVVDSCWPARKADRRGNGLGLGIARGIIEKHGGSIHVESMDGIGTTFAFELPLLKKPAALALSA